MNKKRTPPQELSDLVSIGKAALEDFEILGINTLDDLCTKDPRELYEILCKKTGVKHDPCVEDVFKAAIEQAKDPNLDPEKKQWYYWSRVRKGSL
ncbi:MAG: hypothetical protein SP1CHLAM54_03320 [Chlamydiia bacterium]|nr:hypothetical protein [Chlamydiia bacterium]MCH9615248.1 hypothetical protein [Chlamydiia bacterium]MCH9628430.1 hypothetical protein [Chlamydiia bacterium]